MLVLRRASDDSIVDDIIAHAAEMRFERAAKALDGKKVFLVTAEYDRTVPTEPLDSFWDKLGDSVQKRRKTYHAGHSLMGARLAFAADLKDFILTRTNAQVKGMARASASPMPRSAIKTVPGHSLSKGVLVCNRLSVPNSGTSSPISCQNRAAPY